MKTDDVLEWMLEDITSLLNDEPAHDKAIEEAIEIVVRWKNRASRMNKPTIRSVV